MQNAKQNPVLTRPLTDLCERSQNVSQTLPQNCFKQKNQLVAAIHFTVRKPMKMINAGVHFCQLEKEDPLG